MTVGDSISPRPRAGVGRRGRSGPQFWEFWLTQQTNTGRAELINEIGKLVGNTSFPGSPEKIENRASLSKEKYHQRLLKVLGNFPSGPCGDRCEPLEISLAI